MDPATDRHLNPDPRTLKRPPAYSMRALGKAGLPAMIKAGGAHFALERTVKHDFFAATGFYDEIIDPPREGPVPLGRRVVLKMGRTQPFAGVPLAWVGRWLCDRELRFYTKLADLPNVPDVLGRVGTTGFVHAYAEGHPLSKDRPVPDAFFDQLFALFAELHRRDVAYVDANKPQNILLGDDGRPHLIDFQISWDAHGLLGRSWPSRWWLRHLQREDIYHALKHKRRLRPDQLTPEELARSKRQSFLIRLHRIVTKPYFLIRRAIWARLRASGRLLPEGSA